MVTENALTRAIGPLRKYTTQRDTTKARASYHDSMMIWKDADPTYLS